MIVEVTFKIPADQLMTFVNLIWDGLSANFEDTDPEIRAYLYRRCNEILDQEDRRSGGLGYINVDR